MKLTGIEAARGIAAIMVVFYHAANHMRHNIGYLPLGGIAQFGHAGVDFFFVLSGFIIYYVHGKDLNNPGRLINYAQRRFARIYPLYWFVIIFTLILELIFAKSSKPDFLNILSSATLYPTLDDPYIGVAWTLQHEIIFYSIFAIAITNYRLGLAAFTAWLIAIMVSWVIGYNNHQNGLVSKMLSLYSIEFFFGILAAWITLKARNSSELFEKGLDKLKSENGEKKFLLVAGALLFLIFGIAENMAMYNKYSNFARLAYGISSMLMVIGLAGIKEIKNRNISKIFSAFGSASFSIYLTHLIFIGIVYKILEISGLFAALDVWFTYFLLSSAGIFGGVIVSRFIEHPLTELTRCYVCKAELAVKDISISS